MRRSPRTLGSLVLTALVVSFLPPAALHAHEGHEAAPPSALDPLT